MVLEFCLTSLIVAKFDGLVQLQFISICFRIEAVERLQDDSETSRARVNGTPGRNIFECIDQGFDILKMFFAEASYRFALRLLGLFNT